MEQRYRETKIKSVISWIIALIFAVAALVVAILPFIFMVLNSFKNKFELLTNGVFAIPQEFNVSNYQEVFETDIVSKKAYHARQELCTHPVWYFMGATKDDYEGRIYWNCMCMRCGKIEERRSKDFDKDSVIYKDMCFGKPKNIDIDFYHTGILYGKFINLGDNKSNEEEKSKMFVKIMKRKDVQERLNRTKLIMSR